MSELEEFRRLNDRVKSGDATPDEQARWARLKEALISSTRDSTPPAGSSPVRVQRR